LPGWEGPVSAVGAELSKGGAGSGDDQRRSLVCLIADKQAVKDSRRKWNVGADVARHEGGLGVAGFETLKLDRVAGEDGWSWLLVGREG